MDRVRFVGSVWPGASSGTYLCISDQTTGFVSIEKTYPIKTKKKKVK